MYDYFKNYPDKSKTQILKIKEQTIRDMSKFTDELIQKNTKLEFKIKQLDLSLQNSLEVVSYKEVVNYKLKNKIHTLKCNFNEYFHRMQRDEKVLVEKNNKLKKTLQRTISINRFIHIIRMKLGLFNL